MRLSIITINYNNADGLRKTMVSVFAQTYRDFEYIIVDGASTDGSVDVIRELASSNPLTPNPLTLTWSSEPDTGIYNAMNKGIEIASGKRVVDTFNRSKLCGDKNKGNEESYVLMLNSGDYFVDEHVIEKIIPELDGTDIIQGNVIEVEDGVERINSGYGRSDLSFIDVMKGFFLHQASFCRRELFDKYGYFDESYCINGDTVFYAKCLAFGNATFRYVNHNIAYFDKTGISADPEGKWKKLRAEEDKRYMDMYSDRMHRLLTEEDKKIRLHNHLHSHKWSWYLTMAVAQLVNLFYEER
jgi:glycosyltransferase involved in cell wall biosynthesis